MPHRRLNRPALASLLLVLSACGTSTPQATAGVAENTSEGPSPDATSTTATQADTSTSSSGGLTTTTSTTTGASTTTAADSSGGFNFDLGMQPDVGAPIDPGPPVLWFTAGNTLVYVELDPADGTVTTLVDHEIVSDTEVPAQGTGLAMLEDGGLVMTRGPGADFAGNYENTGSLVYYAASPPTTIAGTAAFEYLGELPDQVAVEGLHVDCEGLLYLMDSGTNSGSAEENRLLRFTGDYLMGDLSYEVITDLRMADVADIDDMGPGIDADGQLTDSRGFAIDSGTVYDFDYLTGNGVSLGMAGTYGIHVLGGSHFDDDTPRLYVLGAGAELFELDPVTLASSDVLVSGPGSGNSGLAGPSSACQTGFPPAG